MTVLESTGSKEAWEVAQKGEREWWGDCCDTWEEEQKQRSYAERMGLDWVEGNGYDLHGKSVLDIGGGPVSLLLKCFNYTDATVVDPMHIPKWAIGRYEENGIGYNEEMGECIDDKWAFYDEVWMYNVLLHTKDPKKIIENAKVRGALIRIFEWVDTPKNDMHPHTLTKEMLDEWLGCDGVVEDITYGNNYVTKSYAAIVERPITGEWEHEDPVGEPGAIGPTGLNELADCEGRRETGGNGILQSDRPKRFHLPGLPHVATNKNEALCCAFSQKVIKMAQMLKSLGHTVFFYGVEGSEVECDEFIQVSTQAVLKEAYGDYDMRKVTYKHAQGDIAYDTFNTNTTAAIKERMQPNDFLLIPFSPPRYRGILDALDTPFIDKKDKLHLVVEMGIGYRGTSCRFKVFESISQQHYNYGLEATDMGATKNGNFYDAVIPNYFDPDDFEYSDKKGDYFLFLGRVVHRKGIAVAIKTVEKMGRVFPGPVKLVVAGQDGGEKVDLSSPNVEYVGFADVEKRKELLKGAKALFAPTQYIEPFGGVIIEAAFSGTPVITTNWGAFPELVLHGKTGYRCSTLDHFVWAAKNIDKVKPIDCYNYAMSNFSLDRVRWMYEEYFNMLLDVKENVDGKGWNRLRPERTELDWLKKER